MGISEKSAGIKLGVMEADFEEWAARCIARNAKNAADESLLLEICGLRPYKRGKRRKADAAKSPVIKYPVPGQ